MNSPQRAAASLHLAALGVWVGIIIATAASAAIIFPTVRATDPVIPHLDAATRPHWLLVAGKPAAAIFAFSHAAQVFLTLCTLATWFFILPAVDRSRCRLAWSVTLLAGCSTLIYYAFFFWPAMRTDLTAYWQATTDGNTAAAAAHQAAFNGAHPTASNLLLAVLILVTLALLSGTWVMLPRRQDKAT